MKRLVLFALITVSSLLVMGEWMDPENLEEEDHQMENQPKHTNRLIHEISPYLLQHAHNPVNWPLST